MKKYGEARRSMEKYGEVPRSIMKSAEVQKYKSCFSPLVSVKFKLKILSTMLYYKRFRHHFDDVSREAQTALKLSIPES